MIIKHVFSSTIFKTSNQFTFLRSISLFGHFAMTCGSFATRKIDLVVDTLWLTKLTCIVGDVVLWWVCSLKQRRLTALAGCMKWVLEFDTCALDHHLISPGPLTMWLRGVTWRFKGKFSIFSLRYTVTYQAAWKFTSRAGWSSGFRGAPLRWLDLEKIRHVYANLHLQVDLSSVLHVQ